MEFYYAAESGLALLAGLFSGMPSLLFTAASYVLTAFALYTIAKRRGLHKPWLAWIPVADIWLVGSISDQYRYVVKGENKSKRKILLTLNILQVVLSIASVAAVSALIFRSVGSYMRYSSEAQILQAVLSSAVTVIGMVLPLIAAALACKILRFIALYDVYRSLDPENSVLYLVLSILFGITEPFFLFFNRNKDLGMPPRRPEPVHIPPQEPWEQKTEAYM